MREIPIYISTSKADYNFPGVNLTNVTMRSAIFLPDIPSLEGVLVYFHPTIIGKGNAPHALLPEIKAIGGLYASRGMAVVFPDYLGFENDSLPHPYCIYPEQNARSAVVALN